MSASLATALRVLLLVCVPVAFLAYCEVDILRAHHVRHLPKWLWAIVCVAMNPLGGIAYLVVGRRR